MVNLTCQGKYVELLDLIAYKHASKAVGRKKKKRLINQFVHDAQQKKQLHLFSSSMGNIHLIHTRIINSQMWDINRAGATY